MVNDIKEFAQLGIMSLKSGDFQKAISCFEKVIEINPSHTSSHNNLGLVFKELGDLKKAKNCFEKVIQIDPTHEKSFNNLGIVHLQSGELSIAKKNFERAIELNPNYANAFWNLHSLSLNIDEALITLKKLCEIDNNYVKAEIIISALEGFRGNLDKFNKLNSSSVATHPFMRSVNWFFSLPKLPKIYFNRWSFFDGIVELSDRSRPFYEFGVWYGITFKYLIKKFKRGFGFDTFEGLPETWHHETKGRYSSFGTIPKINGGEFIVGKFQDTLPKFFLKERPLASIINFDADLYSSTLCALINSNDIIDENTILIFDEFLMNNKWEEDEYKALNEFCTDRRFSYDVIGVSFFSKQVAVRLKKN